ncbi:MAG: hypothetical protein ACFFEY_11095 [Candidatus Thorarchaeota archaeon]
MFVISFFEKYATFFPIIGGVLTILALFAPTSFSTDSIATYYVWMFQTYLHTDPPPIRIGLLRWDPTLLTFSVIFSVIIFLSALIIIWISIKYRKNSINFKKFKNILLILAILISILTLAWIIMMEVYYMIYGANHWVGIGSGHYIPHFGIIGPFIGSIFVVLGILLERKYKKIK